MEDVPMRVEGANDDTIDPLDIMAGVAAQAAPAAKPKRKAAVQAGRDVCFVHGCDCVEGLVGIPPAHVADAMHVMQHEMGIDLGSYGGKPRTLPLREDKNKICVKCRPTLPAKQIIGAKVLVKQGTREPLTQTHPDHVRADRVAR
jgi:hypothetical protein